MKKEWFTAAELAGLRLPDMPANRTAVANKAERDGWRQSGTEWSDANPLGLWRRRKGNGGGFEYHYALLPRLAQAALVRQFSNPPPSSGPKAGKKAKTALAAEEMWKRFEALPEVAKERARMRHRALLAVTDHVMAGTRKVVAVQIVGDQKGFGKSAFHEWEGMVAGIDKGDWLAYLADHRPGRTTTSEMSEEAWEIIKTDYLREEAPLVAECYRRLVDANRKGNKGWIIPSQKTVGRRLLAIDARVRILKREGQESHDRTYPAQRRDRTGLHALEAVNYDGHKIDVFVRWEDGGKTERAFLLAFQDLYSGMIVGWRLDRCENALGFRLAFLDVVQTYGVPDHVFSDNTMAAAAKENTGGSRWRNRYKIKEDDAIGLFADVGSEIHFTKPAHGQSKPIERAFGDLSRYISKAPECAGAYTGNSPTNKPANYGSKVIDVKDLIPVVEREVARFNTWAGRQSSTAKNRSYADVFAESYAQSPIRKAVPEKIRKWLLAGEPVTCRKPDGALHLYGNRYWSEQLIGLIGTKVVARFDPDNLHNPMAVYRLDGSFVCEAECHADTGYMDTAGAKEHARKLKQHAKTSKELAALEVSLGVSDVAAVQPKLTEPEMPETRVVRMPVAGNTALKPAEDAELKRQSFDYESLARGLTLVRGGKE